MSESASSQSERVLTSQRRCSLIVRNSSAVAFLYVFCFQKFSNIHTLLFSRDALMATCRFFCAVCCSIQGHGENEGGLTLPPDHDPVRNSVCCQNDDEVGDRTEHNR